LTATLAIEAVGPDHRLSSAAVLQSAYQERLEDVAAERDQRAAEARSAQERFQVAMEQVSRQQSAILLSPAAEQSPVVPLTADELHIAAHVRHDL